MGIIWATDNEVSKTVIETKKTFRLCKMFRKGKGKMFFFRDPIRLINLLLLINLPVANQIWRGDSEELQIRSSVWL